MRNLLIITLVLFTASVMNGQIAFRGGLNYSNVKVDSGGPDFGTDSKAGYHLGLQGDIGLGGIHLRPALLFHLKGGKLEENGASDNVNLHYLEFPLNLALNIGGDKLALILEAGPYFGYLLNTSSGFIDDLDNRLNKTDWGANFGAVIELSDIGFGVNYSNSLSSISKEDQLGQAFKTTNGNLSLFGYLKF